MNDLEQRLREDLKAYARRAQPDAIRPLRAPAPRARTRTVRWLAPVAAAAAVITVVAVVAVAGRSVANRQAPAGAPAGTPQFYVTVAATPHYQRSPKPTKPGGRITPQNLGHSWATVTVTVRDTTTGQVLATQPLPKVANPFPGQFGISAAANDRLFAISSGPDVYLLSINADGQPTAFRRVQVGADYSTSGGAVLSPDGRQLLFDAESCNPYCSFGIEVLSLATGAHKSWYSGWLGADGVYWTANGKQVLFNSSGSKHSFWLLNVAGSGGNLATDSRPLALPETTAPVLPSPDGRSLITSTIASGGHGTTIVGKIVAMSASTGKLQQVLHTATIPHRGNPYASGIPSYVLALGPTGLRPLVLCFGLGWIENGHFKRLPGGPANDAQVLYWDAAW